MAIEDDDKPRKKVSHEIGQDLSLLSVEELTERVALLNTEIARLEEAATKKRASRDAADSFSRSRAWCSPLGSRTWCSAKSAFTRVFDALWRCSAEPGPMLRAKLSRVSSFRGGAQRDFVAPRNDEWRVCSAAHSASDRHG
ncbi:hypothetical protein BJ6T_83390 [Bradyrhizobium japonicum USDA 6]|nr:hypothetical protein BJ6T_83390 [Bradyrhizobium japonicum USDA 6]